MLVILPYGVAVDPDIVKMISVRADRPQGRGPQAPLIFSVTMKTEGEERMQVLASFESREQAEELAHVCAMRVNKALGEDAEQDYDQYGKEGGGEAPARSQFDDLLD